MKVGMDKTDAPCSESWKPGKQCKGAVVKGTHVLGSVGVEEKGQRRIQPILSQPPFKKSQCFVIIKTDLKEFLNVNQYNQR